MPVSNLTQTELAVISQARQFVSEKLSNDYSGHDIAHIDRVVNLTNQLLRSFPQANAFVAILSAYLHDVIDEKIAIDVTKAEKAIQNFFHQHRLPPQTQLMIFDIIKNMSYRKNLTYKRALSLEGKIVQDADRLDAIGAIGIARAFYYGGHHCHKMHDPDQPPRDQLSAAEYKQPNTVVNHFYEKLLRLKDQMHTEVAKEIATKRHEFVFLFVKQFEHEWLLP